MKKIEYQIDKQKDAITNTYVLNVFENGRHTQSITTAFSRKKYAQKLALLCNKYDVESVHVLDIMDNMIYDIKMEALKWI